MPPVATAVSQVAATPNDDDFDLSGLDPLMVVRNALPIGFPRAYRHIPCVEDHLIRLRRGDADVGLLVR